MHQAVLLKEVLALFNPQPGQTYIDATINGGGHSTALLEKIGPEGTLLGIDWDCELLEKIKNQKSEIRNLILVCDNYAHLGTIARKYHLEPVNGILFDLGFSSYHVEISQRGFSFMKNEPLDMRYNTKENELTAFQIINYWPAEAIENILRKYGEEPYARRITEAIIRQRAHKKITTTRELAAIVSRSIPRLISRRRKLHPATQTFQALRIAVNKELENLERGLKEAIAVLGAGGKIIVISFHSLEDRLVKNFFRDGAKIGMLEIITQKPIRASREELLKNPRARSAKLRAAQKRL